MSKLNTARVVYLFTLLGTAVVAGLTLTRVIKSDVVLGVTILIAIAIVAFRLGVRYRELEGT
ncbi:hypothetical protein [Halosimplex carlsbadense]|uniref:hypothetical protein n=1 Tax=Halosimplex carlsbadense TaxID=171164 RepID=UPI001267996A|nr:hypothetical protein [Halosimplex carlsbadense]